jgi:hypothetical protein
MCTAVAAVHWRSTVPGYCLLGWLLLFSPLLYMQLLLLLQPSSLIVQAWDHLHAHLHCA